VDAVSACPLEFAFAGDPAEVQGKLLMEVTLPKADRPLCDFCGLGLGLRHVDFYAEPFARLNRDVGPWLDGLLVTYDERWAACRLCAPHVRTRNWPRLADGVTRRRRDAGRPINSRGRAEFVALWMQLDQLLYDEVAS
jgi:hypothetical protein